jgi:hypothetical protein
MDNFTFIGPRYFLRSTSNRHQMPGLRKEDGLSSVNLFPIPLENSFLGVWMDAEEWHAPPTFFFFLSKKSLTSDGDNSQESSAGINHIKNKTWGTCKPFLPRYECSRSGMHVLRSTQISDTKHITEWTGVSEKFQPLVHNQISKPTN